MVKEKWVTLTRRTTLPKLTWIMIALRNAGMLCRLNGDSFHAPILEVQKKDFERAWNLLGPIDDLSDDDAMFSSPDQHSQAWWSEKNEKTEAMALVVAAVGLAANKVRRSIADRVKCVPEGASKIDCPLAIGLIETCPQRFWTVCKPMVRLEVFGLAMASTMNVDEEKAIELCDGLIRVMKDPDVLGKTESGTFMVAFFHVLALWLTESALERAEELPLVPGDIVVRVMSETVQQPDGKILPRKAVIEMKDLIGKDRLKLFR